MSPAIQVYRKEMREMMRDKRVRSAAFVGPIFMIFMFMALFGIISDSVGKATKPTIHYVKTSAANLALLNAAKIPIVEVATQAEGQKLLEKGTAKVVLSFDEDFSTNLASQKPTKVSALYDASSPKSGIALRTVQVLFTAANKESVKSLLVSNKLDPALSEPIQFEATEVKVGEQGKSNDILIGMLPYLIVIWAFYGGFGIATELVAGEKEKNTLETLLISPVKRSQIALGKFLALGTICLMSSLSSVLGLILVYVLNLPFTRSVFENGLGIGPLGFLTIFVVLVPTVALFAGMLLAVSAYSKNSREAQTYLTLLSFLVLLPSVFSQIIGFTDFGQSMAVNFIPVLNTANNIRNAMLGKFDLGAIGITVAISLVIAAITLNAAIRMFEREEVLTKV
ncbi:MAG: ABC transporter permease [Fimbriimonas sp.]